MMSKKDGSSKRTEGSVIDWIKNKDGGNLRGGGNIPYS
jgi:hypothetical protein